MPGNISGGLKDEDPPRFLYSMPPLYATGFDVNTKRINMTFDEYVQLKDVNAQFVSSSPMKKKPEILLYGKIIRVNLKEPLLPDMTYTFNFGEAIVDNNESNKIVGFQYVFSTGNHIDSLTFTGRVLDAFDLTPGKKEDKVPVSVLLFEDLSDSAVYKTPPTYVARTDNYGFFTFTHIRPGTFRIFAIRDMGDNLLFDMPVEQIAFADSAITVNEQYYRDPDIPFPSSLNLPDSVKEKNPELPHKDIVLYRFQEAPTKQYRTSYERPAANLLRFTYTLPVDSLPIAVADTAPAGKWFATEISPHRDTVMFWLTDTTLIHRNALLISLLSPRTDSLQQLVYHPDTLKMSYEPPKQPADKRSRKEKREDEKSGKIPVKPRTEVETMLISANVRDKIDLIDRLQLTSSQPISDIDRSKITFAEWVDTVKVPVPFTLTEDSSNMRKCFIEWKIKEDTKYSLVVDSMAFTSIYGVYNDSVGFVFTSQKKDYYSEIEITFDRIPCPMLVQILQGDKERVVKQVSLSERNVALIDYLKPDKYKLKVIYDRNGNGKWDTGRYLDKLQPEKVAYYTGEPVVETRSGWKTEIKWTLP
jgi:hypothetical protein